MNCCHCPYCSGYAAGFRDGQASMRGYWSGPYWQVFRYMHQYGLQGQIGAVQAQTGLQMQALQGQVAQCCQNALGQNSQ